MISALEYDLSCLENFIVKANELEPNSDAFLELAKEAALHLPVGIRRETEKLKRSLPNNGYLLIEGLTNDSNLCDTPSNPIQINEKKTHLSEFWLSVFAYCLGDPFSYIQESGNHLFHNVLPTKQNETNLSSQSSRILLDFHTETAFHPFMPEFLELYGLRQDHNKVAETILSSIRNALPFLSEDTINTLKKPLYETGVDYSFGSTNGQKGGGRVIPILYGDINKPMITFDPDLMHGLTEEANQAIQSLKAALDETKIGIKIKPGDLLIVDNRCSVHGRTPFQPFYDGKDRWIQRLYVGELKYSEILFSNKSRIISYDISNNETLHPVFSREKNVEKIEFDNLSTNFTFKFFPKIKNSIQDNFNTNINENKEGKIPFSKFF